MKINKNDVNIKWFKDEILRMEMEGRRRAISTSKIKKIIAIRKNCTLKGMRAELIGSNPHSNGEFFSRSVNVFLDSILAASIVRKAIEIAMAEVVKIIAITYTKRN